MKRSWARVPDESDGLAMPPLFNAVDGIAKTKQTTLLRLRKVEFVSLVVAAAFAEVPGDQLWGLGPVAALVFFGVALLVRVSRSDERAERAWYDARAAAESVKSLSWQYAVAGEAFRRDDAQADEQYRSALREVLGSFTDLDIPVGTQQTAVTTEMRSLRAMSLDERRSKYLEARVDDQLGWYTRKADWNRSRATWWRWGVIALEALAVLLGLARALEWFDVDWLGIFAAAAAAVLAWQQTKNYLGLSQAYAITSHDVSLVKDSMGAESTEDQWAQAVHDAEAAFSREHTLWRARRQGPVR